MCKSSLDSATMTGIQGLILTLERSFAKFDLRNLSLNESYARFELLFK
jgi:hypothetical protein